MRDQSPTREDCVRAVARAAGARRERHRTDPRFAHVTSAALIERVFGLLGFPQRTRGDWWHVGYVIDELADAEFDVWFVPGAYRLGVSVRPIPEPKIPPQPDVIFDGERLAWIDRVTRKPVPAPSHRG